MQVSLAGYLALIVGHYHAYVKALPHPDQLDFKESRQPLGLSFLSPLLTADHIFLPIGRVLVDPTSFIKSLEI